MCISPDAATLPGGERVKPCVSSTTQLCGIDAAVPRPQRMCAVQLKGFDNLLYSHGNNLAPALPAVTNCFTVGSAASPLFPRLSKADLGVRMFVLIIAGAVDRGRISRRATGAPLPMDRASGCYLRPAPIRAAESRFSPMVRVDDKRQVVCDALHDTRVTGITVSRLFRFRQSALPPFPSSGYSARES